MPIARSAISTLSMTDVVEQLMNNDQQSKMNAFIEQNGLKLDRLRKLGDYCATLIYERDPNATIPQPTEIPVERKKGKGSKKKTTAEKWLRDRLCCIIFFFLFWNTRVDRSCFLSLGTHGNRHGDEFAANLLTYTKIFFSNCLYCVEHKTHFRNGALSVFDQIWIGRHD